MIHRSDDIIQLDKGQHGGRAGRFMCTMPKLIEPRHTLPVTLILIEIFCSVMD